MCSAEVDFVFSKKNSLHAYSSLHAAQKIFLTDALLIVSKADDILAA